jgi:hypothetical protein
VGYGLRELRFLLQRHPPATTEEENRSIEQSRGNCAVFSMKWKRLVPVIQSNNFQSILHQKNSKKLLFPNHISPFNFTWQLQHMPVVILINLLTIILLL